MSLIVLKINVRTFCDGSSAKTKLAQGSRGQSLLEEYGQVPQADNGFCKSVLEGRTKLWREPRVVL